MQKLLIDYIRENDQCNYADMFDYFKEVAYWNDELKAKYWGELIMYILEQEQLEANKR